MPSDCQCSMPQDVEIRYVEKEPKVKILNNKQAASKIKKLEEEVRELKRQLARTQRRNVLLTKKLNKALTTKKDIINELIEELNNKKE